ncbi:hypothetical protein B0H16DRAFT_1477891 [Mycena metata]|uniref:Uncharacterized protein n=1 Tax=Mycena metata TaxID=1033252 RepID=A0AAD7H7Z4_9AGAR|nr:hypothetical protein B0H16DRAFT_1477891 [Mycena metata]
MAPKPPPPPLGFSLRKDRDPNPGKPDQVRAKRPDGSVQQDKDKKAAKKTAADRKRTAGIEKAAAIELQQEVADKEVDPNHPPTTAVKKALRQRPQRRPEDDNVGNDDYNPEDDPEDDADGVFDPSDDEDVPAATPSHKKATGKGATRKELNQARDAQRKGLVGSGALPGKRKASNANAADRPVPKKVKPAAVGGLREEYQRRGRTPSSSSSAMSVDAYSEGDTLPPASEYQDSSEGLAGIESDEDEDGEKRWASNHDSEKVGRRLGGGRELENLSQINSLAGIVDTDAADLVPLRRSKSGGLNKSKITLNHLPAAIRSLFNSKWKPVLIRWAATLPAWQDNIESYEDVASIWQATFPKYPLAENRDFQDAVVKLSDDRLNTWRHNFAVASTDALATLLDDWSRDTPGLDRAEAVQWLLEKDPDDGTRVFHWRQYHADPEEGAEADAEPVVKPKGLFGGHLIIQSLASHYKAAYPAGLASRKDLGDSAVPEGPLVYAIQSGQRALTYSKTGKLEVPGQRRGEFSKTNWGDREALIGGEMVAINTTSDLVELVKGLTDTQWNKIIDAAIAAARPSRKSSRAAEEIDVDNLPVAKPPRQIIDYDSD